MKKKVSVVMLPTEKASQIYKHSILSTGCESLGWFSEFKITDNTTKIGDFIHYINTYQHLYFLSDDEIKEKDWIFANQGVHKVIDLKKDNYPYGTNNKNGDKIYHHKNWKKIIATTNEELNLPRPSNEFLKKYCELGGINKVLVEYDCDHSQMPNKVIDVLKVAPDNTINIKFI